MAEEISADAVLATMTGRGLKVSAAEVMAVAAGGTQIGTEDAINYLFVFRTLFLGIIRVLSFFNGAHEIASLSFTDCFVFRPR